MVSEVSYINLFLSFLCIFMVVCKKRSVARLPLVGLIRFAIFYKSVCLLFSTKVPSLKLCMDYLFDVCSKCLGCIYVQREDKTSGFKGVSGTVLHRWMMSIDVHLFWLIKYNINNRSSLQTILQVSKEIITFASTSELSSKTNALTVSRVLTLC